MIKQEELKVQSEIPKETFVVNRQPVPPQQKPSDPESDFVQQLLQEEQAAKANLAKEDKELKDAKANKDYEKYQQVKAKQDQKFVDLMDDLGM